jgi:hypothetical protein
MPLAVPQETLIRDLEVLYRSGAVHSTAGNGGDVVLTGGDSSVTTDRRESRAAEWIQQQDDQRWRVHRNDDRRRWNE